MGSRSNQRSKLAPELVWTDRLGYCHHPRTPHITTDHNVDVVGGCDRVGAITIQSSGFGVDLGAFEKKKHVEPTVDMNWGLCKASGVPLQRCCVTTWESTRSGFRACTSSFRVRVFGSKP